MSNGETVLWWIHVVVTAWWSFLCFTRGRERRSRFFVMLNTSVVFAVLAFLCRVFPRFSAYHLLWLAPGFFYVTGILTVRRISFKEFGFRYAPPALPSLLLIVGMLVFAVSKLPWWVIAGGLLLVFLSFSSHLGSERNERLEEWASSVPISPNVRRAMDDLIATAKATLAAGDQTPVECPLERLTPDERQYLLKICSPAFVPEEFGTTSKFAVLMRASEIRDLTEKGLADEQARIVVGMSLNGFIKSEKRGKRESTTKSSNPKISLYFVSGGYFLIS